MKKPEVVLVGYYGRGNFGDDILMITAHKVARKVLPGSTIGIRSSADRPYPARLIGEDVIPIPFGTRDRHRLIVHGGGGTFFDFSPHPVPARIINVALLAGGARSFVMAENTLRSLVKKPRMSAYSRIGLGIGIGTFTPGSRKLLAALPLLSEFDHLWVRDLGSKENLAKLSVALPVIVGSDLAFLLEDWCPPELTLQPQRSRPARPRVGVILRDWPPGSGACFADAFRPVMEALSVNYDLTLVSFDPATDIGTLCAFPDYPQLVWQPESMELREFLTFLSEHDVFLTSRAHGAICGACLGRPSVILEIEPKLAAVHAMLPAATRIALPHSDAKTISRQIDEALCISTGCLMRDVIHNRELSEKALNTIIRGLNP
ncbi:MAG: polysaccharide pyruvyl transferase family protein [Hyphomicrobiales bacterium]|nr:MAG: polysaccharide pyruvyl transferase family protein [Hyphomicrobiales bacterium]